MKKMVPLLLAMVACLLMLVGCDNTDNNDNTDIPNQDTNNITYLSESELYFASGCDYALIENYFKENGLEVGDSYIITSSKDYGVVSNGSSIKYTPKDKSFQIIFAVIENQSDTYLGGVYQCTYKGAIQVKLNQPLTNATYLGEYEYQFVGITSSKSAYYTAGFTFRNINYITLTEISDYKNISCSGQITYADNWQSASKMFEKDNIGEKCYKRIGGCLNALDKLFKEIDNTYNIAGKFISPNECNHIAVVDKGYAATCLDEGKTDGSHCKICNTILEEKKTIPANGHTPVTDKGYAATCTEVGLTDGSHCKVCNTVLTEQQTIPAKHNYVDRECTVCHKLEPSKGLEFSSYYLTGYGDCYGVKGIGTCTDTCLVIPDTYNNVPVRVIGSGAIEGNTFIEKVVLYNNIVSIQNDAFMNCTNLKQIILPKTLETIGRYAFYNTGYHNDMANWESEVLYLNTYLLSAKKEITGNYIIKNGTTLIADDSFAFCENITALSCSESLLYIGNNAFSYCKELASIKLSNNILGIGSGAFYNCKINSISLSKTLRFYYAGSDIKTINYAGTVAEWNNVRTNGTFKGVTVKCLNGTIKASY